MKWLMCMLLGRACATPRFRVRLVQLVHRHGDRTPITKLANADFWREQLPSPSKLAEITAAIAVGDMTLRSADAMNKNVTADSEMLPVYLAIPNFIGVVNIPDEMR